MKKFTVFVLILSLFGLLLFVGCSNNDIDYDNNKNDEESGCDNKDGGNGLNNIEEETDEVAVFVEYILTSEYSKAIDYYKSDIYGNYELEHEAQEQIVVFCEDINEKTLSGEYTEKQTNTRLNVIERVVEGIELYPEGYEETVYLIQTALESKSAFSAAQNLEELGNFIDASYEYKKVIKEDANYILSQEGAERCIELYKTDIFDEVQSFAKDKDYLSAIRLLNTASEKLPDDSDIVSKIAVYKKTYINSVVTAAEEVFDVPVTDYESALAIINAALQHYPNDEELNAKKTYYASFAPKRLADMKEYERDGRIIGSLEDLYGKEHKNVLCPYMYNDYACVIYVLNGEYNKLTITVFGNGSTYSGVDKKDVTVRDYSSGDYDTATCLYSSGEISPTSKDFQVEIDVTGVQLIRIWVGETAYIADCMIQKTEK